MFGIASLFRQTICLFFQLGIEKPGVDKSANIVDQHPAVPPYGKEAQTDDDTSFKQVHLRIDEIE
jgi:hypothetical protein